MTVESENQLRPKLLIIDDEPWITELIEAEVEELFLSVRSINDSKLIRSTYNDFKPDIIFLDLGLQGYDGVDILKFLAVIRCKAKIYLISGMGRSALESCQLAGVKLDLNIVGALTKPFTGEDIRYALSMPDP